MHRDGLSDKHLVYWMLKIYEARLDKESFDLVAAPDWAWPAYKEKLRIFDEMHRHAK